MSEVIERTGVVIETPRPPSSPAIPSLGGFEVVKVSEQETWIKMMVWGTPGVGKTRLAGSALEVAEMCPVLFIDIEGGTLSLKELYGDVDRIQIVDKLSSDGQVAMPAWKRLNGVFEAMRRGMPYKTVVIDNLSEGQKLSMNSVMRDTVIKDPDRDLDVPAQRDWGKSGEQIRRMVRAFRDLPCHVIFTAWEARKIDQQTGVVTLEPSLPGKLAGEVPGYLDLVLYMYSREAKIEGQQEVTIERLLLSQPTRKVVTAKDRSGKLPTVMHDPTMAKIMELALG